MVEVATNQFRHITYYNAQGKLMAESMLPTTWTPELSIEPPGWEDIAGSRYEMRSTITPDGETNINNFYGKQDEAKTLALMGASQYVNLGGMRSPPQINSPTFNAIAVNAVARGGALLQRFSRSDGAVSFAFDPRTSRFSFQTSGNPPVDKSIVNPSMNILINDAKANGVTGLGGPRTCCEFKAINNLLNRGSQRENIMYQVIDVRTQRSLEGCSWCRFTGTGANGLNGN